MRHQQYKSSKIKKSYHELPFRKAVETFNNQVAVLKKYVSDVLKPSIETV